MSGFGPVSIDPSIRYRWRLGPSFVCDAELFSIIASGKTTISTTPVRTYKRGIRAHVETVLPPMPACNVGVIGGIYRLLYSHASVEDVARHLQIEIDIPIRSSRATVQVSRHFQESKFPSS